VLGSVVRTYVYALLSYLTKPKDSKWDEFFEFILVTATDGPMISKNTIL